MAEHRVKVRILLPCFFLQEASLDHPTAGPPAPPSAAFSPEATVPASAVRLNPVKVGSDSYSLLFP